MKPEEDGLAVLAALLIIADEPDPEEQKRMVDRFKHGLTEEYFKHVGSQWPRPI
jgi:predicted secreted protein